MRKKALLAEKLRKISEGDTTTPLFKRRMLKDKLSKLRDRGKEVSARAEKSFLPTVIDFGLPESKVKGFLRVETSSQEGELVQTLYSLDNPKKRVKWTVLEDPQGWEFDTIKEEGLTKVKDYPPVYAYETGDGALLASHVGGFTFTVGGTLVSTRELINIFSLGLNQAKKLDLGVSPLEKELAKSSEKIKELKKSLKKKEVKIEILKGESTHLDELEEEIERKDHAIVSKSSRAEKLRENITKLKSDIVYLKNLLEEYKVSIDGKDRVIAEQKKRIEEIDNELTRIKNLRLEDKEEIGRLKNELEIQESSMASQSPEIARLKRESDSLKSEVENLRESLKEKETQISVALSEKKELESKLVELEDDKEKLSKSMEAELDILKESIKSKDEILSDFNNERSNFEAKIAELGALLDDKEKLISDQKEELSRVKGVREAVEKELKILKGKLKEKDRIIASRESEIKILGEGRVALKFGPVFLGKSVKSDSPSISDKLIELENKIKEKDESLDALKNELKLLDAALNKEFKERALYEKKFTPWILATLDKKLAKLNIEKKVAQDLYDALAKKEGVDERVKSIRKKKLKDLTKNVEELDNMMKELKG